MHYAPQPDTQAGVHPLHGAAYEVSHDCLRKEQSAGSADGTHGRVLSEGLPQTTKLRQREPEHKAAGLKAVVWSFYYALTEAGPIRGSLPLLRLNQTHGFDCPGCAWADPDGKRSAFDFCENGAKAIAHELDHRSATPNSSRVIRWPSCPSNPTTGSSSRAGSPSRWCCGRRHALPADLVGRGLRSHRARVERPRLTERGVVLHLWQGDQ
jgi:hypothetical protein